MFAGPNGSGKSTIKSTISADVPGLFETYLNPDEIERGIRDRNFLDFQEYGFVADENDVLYFFSNSSFLKQVHMAEKARDLEFDGNKLIFNKVKVNAYYASVASDFIRHKLLELGKSFTFETVMSSADKVEFLRKAQMVHESVIK